MLSTSSRIQPAWFTIAGRPAAKVSNSLLGELVASTGTSLKIVRHASDAAARRATVVLSGVGSRNTTLSAPSARASRSSSARCLPPPRSTKVTPVHERRGAHDLGEVVGLAEGAEVAAHEAVPEPEPGTLGVAVERRGEQLQVGGVRHQHDPLRVHAGRRHAVADARRERDHACAAAVHEALERAGQAPRERIAQRAHLDRGLRPQVAHLEHERRAVAGRGQQGRQRDRERRRGGVDHVGTRPAQRVQRGGHGKAREGQHPARVGGGGGAHVVGVAAARAHHLDAVHLAAAGGRGYHPHGVSAVHEPARELV